MNMVLAIIEQAALFLPLMLGAYLSIALMKVPDLSLESAFTFGAILSAKCMPLVQGLPQVFGIPCVVLAAFVGGALVGCVSSFLTQKMGFAHLLSSIVTIGIFYGVNQIVLGTSNLSMSAYNNPLAFSYLGHFPELPTFLLISALLFALLMALLKTPLGYCFALYGENPYFFKNHKISTAFVFSACIIMSNGIS